MNESIGASTQSELDEKVSGIHQTVAQLEVNLNQMEDRLKRILRPEIPAPPSAEPPNALEHCCPLSDRIRSVHLDLGMLVRRIEKLTERLAS